MEPLASEDEEWFDGVRRRSPSNDPQVDGDSDEDDSETEEEPEADPYESEEDTPDCDEDRDSPDGEDEGEEGDDWTDDDSDDADDDSLENDSDDPPPETPGPGESRDSARAPILGEMVLTELMIDPDAVHDRLGEWVEISNTSPYWLDLAGHRLGDDGVDDVEFESTESEALIVAPGAHLIICGEADYWDNGGVDCHGTFRYWTFGDGFAMSNTEDEVILISPGGHVLDRVAWDDDFAVVGAAMGVESGAITIDANDSLLRWCDQWSYLPFGDAGTPGETNDSCW
jgi:hypothetical protein